MKKTVMLLLVVSFSLLFGSFKVKGEGPYIVENLLNLSNMIISPMPDSTGAPYYISSIEPIELQQGKVYTFIIGATYFDDRGYDHPLFYYTLCYTLSDYETGECIEYESDYTIRSDYAYHEIEMVHPWLEFKVVMIDFMPDTPNQDMMLIEGNIDKFNGDFTNYKTEYNTQNWVYLKDYDDNLSVSDIISSISVLDSETTTFNVIVDEYTMNQNVLGESNIILMAKNTSNNKFFLRIIVNTVDIAPPVFTGESTYNIPISKNMPTLAEIIKDIVVTDNYTFMHEQEYTITFDDYTYRTTYLGDHLVVLEATDCSGNKSTFNVNINVYDDIPPVIKGPVVIFRYSTDPIMTEEEIKSFFTVEDNVDDELLLINNLEIVGSYENIPGVYEYTLTVSDSAGNITTHILNINVLNGNLPVFVDSETYIITYQQYKNMTHEEMKAWILAGKEGVTDIEIIMDEAAYLRGKDKLMYVYYKYMLNGKVHYGRILIEPSKETTYSKIIIISALVIINISFLGAFLKRPKIHL